MPWSTRSMVLVALGAGACCTAVTALILRQDKANQLASSGAAGGDGHDDGDGGAARSGRGRHRRAPPQDRSTAQPGPRGVVEMPDMILMTGTFRLEVSVVLRVAPDESSPARTTIPAEAEALRVGEHGGWTLVRWTGQDGVTWFGWVVLARDKQASGGGSRSALGTVRGVVHLDGEPPRMVVPSKRADAEVCRDKQLPLNAVLVDGGNLVDVFVRVAGVAGKWDAPKQHAVVEQRDCEYVPRIQGVVEDQEVDIKNGDLTLHNVHAYSGTATLFNQAEPQGAPPITKAWGEAAILKLSCDVHPWMRAFVVVSPHPFFAVTGRGGTFQIADVPPGTYEIEAWHSQYGWKRDKGVSVRAGAVANVDFEFKTSDPEPDENRGELEGVSGGKADLARCCATIQQNQKSAPPDQQLMYGAAISLCKSGVVPPQFRNLPACK